MTQEINYLYLVQDIECFKIGITKNLDNRKKTYSTHNPYSVWVCEVAVPERSRESLLRRELRRRGYKNLKSANGKKYKSDWFEGSLEKEDFIKICRSLYCYQEESIQFTQYSGLVLEGFLKMEGVPYEALYQKWKEDEHEWISYLEIQRIGDSYKISNTTGVLLFLLFAIPEKTAAFYLEYLGIPHYDLYRSLPSSSLIP